MDEPSGSGRAPGIDVVVDCSTKRVVRAGPGLLERVPALADAVARSGSWVDLFAPEDSDALEQAWRRLQAQGRAQRVVASLAGVEEQRIGVWLVLEGAEGARVVRLLFDETVSPDLRSSRFRAAARMDAIAKLSAGLTHDFNNQLQTAIVYASFLLEHDLDREARADAEVVAQAARRASQLVGQLLSFTRSVPSYPVLLDVNPVVQEVRPMLASAARRIPIELELDAETSRILADVGQLQLALVVLTQNAIDAMPHGGSVTVRTRSVRDGREPAVELAVIDDGVGMDAETLRHAFEPFFTTKDDTEGTGLGLYAVQDFVRSCGGRVHVDSEVGVGTEVRLVFPAALEETPVQAPARVEAPRGAGGARVLVVEDNRPERRMMARILARQGYGVVEAADADEALQSGALHEVDLLLSDVWMPGRDGLELARALRSLRPDLPILLTSGYVSEELMSALREDHTLAFLPKPFLPEQLTRLVARAVSPRRHV